MKMPKQVAPIARNLNTTAQATDQNGVEASFWGSVIGAVAPVAIDLIRRAVS